MATGLEVVGAASTLISIIGFSAQVFDGCVKGLVLLSTAQNLGRDADILRSMLEWEQFRLEQWGEKAGLQDPATADILMDWKLINDTLQHLKNLTNDTEALKKKYNLVLVERAPNINERTLKDEEEAEEKASKNRFKRLFSPSGKSSSAAAKVIQSRNSAPKKLWWAAVDKNNFEKLVQDISHFVQRLQDCLSLSIQAQMQKQIESLLCDATQRFSNVPDLEVLRKIAAQMRKDASTNADSDAGKVGEAIERKFIDLMFEAIRKGDVEQVALMLDKGISIYAGQPGVGWPPLVRAAEYGQLAVVELLLARGADPAKGTSGNRLPLQFAAEEGHEAVVKVLLKQPNNTLNQRDFCSKTALFKAANGGHASIVELLLQQEEIEPDAASTDDFTPLSATMFDNHREAMKLLLARPDVDPNHRYLYDQTPLWAASAAGGEILEMYLKRPDIKVDLQGRFQETPLYHAVRWAGPRSIQMLLDAGADPNIGDYEGRTPLSCAANEGKEDNVQLLLKQPGVDVEKVDTLGKSPLSLASKNGHMKCIRLLLSSGANIESCDNDKRTALSLAAAEGHKIVAKLLLKHGANVNVQDCKGNTPLALAAENNHDAVVRFLLESGADAELPDEDEETPFEKARDKHMDQITAVFKEALQLKRP